MVLNLLDEMLRKEEGSETPQVPVLGIAWAEPWQLWVEAASTRITGVNM